MPSGLFYLNKFQEETKIVRKGHEGYFRSDALLSSHLKEFLKYRQELEADLAYVLNYKKQYAERVERGLKLLNERLRNEQEEKAKLFRRTEELSLALKETEKHNEVLNAEISGLRKANRGLGRGRLRGVCKNCKKIFADDENFNWSCKTHLSGFNGKMYWCCGKTEKSAAGCVVGRHVMEENEEAQEEPRQAVFCSVRSK